MMDAARPHPPQAFIGDALRAREELQGLLERNQLDVGRVVDHWLLDRLPKNEHSRHTTIKLLLLAPHYPFCTLLTFFCIDT